MRRRGRGRGRRTMPRRGMKRRGRSFKRRSGVGPLRVGYRF